MGTITAYVQELSIGEVIYVVSLQTCMYSRKNQKIRPKKWSCSQENWMHCPWAIRWSRIAQRHYSNRFWKRPKWKCSRLTVPRVPREHFSPTSHTLRTSFRIVPEEDAVSWSQLIILAVGNYMKKMQKIFFTSCSRELEKPNNVSCFTRVCSLHRKDPFVMAGCLSSLYWMRNLKV